MDDTDEIILMRTLVSWYGQISNLGVLEVVCRTVLENGFSVLALQEVASKDVLEKVSPLKA